MTPQQLTALRTACFADPTAAAFIAAGDANGLRGYLGHYLKPTPLLLPFHLISEITRTVALAVRLATDPGWRAAMRTAVRAAFSRPELTDRVAYARALEGAYTRALSERHLLPS